MPLTCTRLGRLSFFPHLVADRLLWSWLLPQRRGVPDFYCAVPGSAGKEMAAGAEDDAVNAGGVTGESE
jgi:hypothetical protein